MAKTLAEEVAEASDDYYRFLRALPRDRQSLEYAMIYADLRRADARRQAAKERFELTRESQEWRMMKRNGYEGI